MQRTAEELAQLMATYELGPTEQGRQVAYRAQLVDSWGIQPGHRILEIGCGQGDASVVLADRVGPEGLVLGIDTGPGDYGEPLTLSEATNFLMSGPLGKQLEIRLNFTSWDHVPHSFDVAVLAHCAWYFWSEDDLVATLRHARSRAKRLCLTEWSLAPLSPDQVPHYLAATVQNSASRFQPDTTRNIRRAYSEIELAELIEAAGWKVLSREVIARPQVSDGEWEVAMAMELLREDLSMVPEAEREVIVSTLTTLGAMSKPYQALPSISLLAE